MTKNEDKTSFELFSFEQKFLIDCNEFEDASDEEISNICSTLIESILEPSKRKILKDFRIRFIQLKNENIVQATMAQDALVSLLKFWRGSSPHLMVGSLVSRTKGSAKIAFDTIEPGLIN